MDNIIWIVAIVCLVVYEIIALRKKPNRYEGHVFAIVVIVQVTAWILLDGMESHAPAWQLGRVVCIAGISVCAVLALTAWLRRLSITRKKEPNQPPEPTR